MEATHETMASGASGVSGISGQFRSGGGDGMLLQLVTFTLGEEEFGVDILRVQEIIRMMPVTRVPAAPAFVEGIINLRGKVIPVIDMRARFGLRAGAADERTRIMVVEMGGRVAGFIVDSVSQVLRLPASTVEAPPAVIEGGGSDFIRGVGKLEGRLLLLLDLDLLLGESEKAVLDGIR